MKILARSPVWPAKNWWSNGGLILRPSYVLLPPDSAPPVAVDAHALRMLAAVQVFDGVSKSRLPVHPVSVWQRVLLAAYPTTRLKSVQHAALIGSIMPVSLHQSAPPPQLAFCGLPERPLCHPA